MHEEHKLSAWEYDVRSTRKAPHMKTVSISKARENLPHCQLGLSI